MFFKPALFVALATTAISSAAQALELNATSYAISHPESGRVILAKDADKIVQPASLTKLMTLYMLFDALKAGEISLDTQIPVSEKAWRKGGSKMFIEVGKRIPVSELIQGIAVVSGNDACIAVAEYLGGTEESFAQMMTDRARALGMKNTTFKNASGWPDEGHLSTAEDILILAERLKADHPERYEVFSQTWYKFNGIRQPNRNGLLRRGVGVDGLKTGHVEEEGFHLAASAQRNDERFFSVVIGADSSRGRENETLKAIKWAFANYKKYSFFDKGEVLVPEIKVELSKVDSIPAMIADDAQSYLLRSETRNLTATATYNEPLVAPIKVGDKIGDVVLKVDGGDQVVTFDLVAKEEAPELTGISRFIRLLKLNSQ